MSRAADRQALYVLRTTYQCKYIPAARRCLRADIKASAWRHLAPTSCLRVGPPSHGLGRALQ